MVNHLSIQAKEEQDLHIAKHIEPEALRQSFNRLWHLRSPMRRKTCCCSRC
ncbi:MAG: hypothetical protein ACI4AI_04510 [Paludibacteraceae bacterium]